MQSELEAILKEICANKRTLKELTKKGYLPYKGDTNFLGSVAIINNKAIVSYLQDSNDDSRAIATANFIDNGILIFKLEGEKCDETRVGWKNKSSGEMGGFYGAQIHQISRKSVSSQISSACRHCIEAKEKAELESSKSTISKLIKGLKSETDKGLSEKEVLLLVQDTLKALNRSKNIEDQTQTNNNYSKHGKSDNTPKVPTGKKTTSTNIEFDDI